MVQKTREQGDVNLQVGDAVGSLIGRVREQDEINIGELYRLNHVEDAVGSLIEKMRSLSRSVSIMESRHNSLVESLSGSMRGSIDGSMSDIDSVVNSFLEETRYKSRRSSSYGLNTIHQTTESERSSYIIFDGGAGAGAASETLSIISNSTSECSRHSGSIDGGDSRTRRIISMDFGDAKESDSESE